MRVHAGLYAPLKVLPYMFVYKCDSCKKELDQNAKEKAVSIGSGKWGLLKDLLLCEKCGSGILKILKRKQFIK